jgi:hypothetical protein
LSHFQVVFLLLYGEKTTDNRQQTTDNRQQTTDNRQQTTDYKIRHKSRYLR